MLIEAFKTGDGNTHKPWKDSFKEIGMPPEKFDELYLININKHIAMNGKQSVSCSGLV